MARGFNPAKSLSPRLRRLVMSFIWLDTYGKTPLDLGLDSWDDVDPWWHEAMCTIKAGMESQKKIEMNKK